MTKNPKELQFIEDKEETIDNLELLQERLDACVDGGMHDPGEEIHNQLLDLIEETVVVQNYAALEEVISHARILETDLDAWLAAKGRTTVSLSWPRTNQ